MSYLELAQAYAQACRERDMALAQLADIGAGYAEKMDDFVRVVRCKNCRYAKPAAADGFVVCAVMESRECLSRNDYCSFGEGDSFE